LEIILRPFQKDRPEITSTVNDPKHLNRFIFRAIPIESDHGLDRQRTDGRREARAYAVHRRESFKPRTALVDRLDEGLRARESPFVSAM